MKRYIRNAAGIIGAILLVLACSTENSLLITTLGLTGIFLFLPSIVHLIQTEEAEDVHN